MEPVTSVAQKNQNKLEFDAQRGIISIEGVDSESVSKDFKGLETLLKDGFLIDLEKKTWFLESQVEMILSGHKGALDSLRMVYTASSLFNRVGELFGETPATFGLRFCSAQANPIEENWFDFRLDPVVRNTQQYSFYAVYRNADRQKTYSFLEGIETKASKLVALVENEAFGPRSKERTRR